MTIHAIPLLLLFEKYENAKAEYMKANGKFVVVPPTDAAGTALVNDTREQVQMYRRELIARLGRCEINEEGIWQ